MQKKLNSKSKHTYYASLSTYELENILQLDFQTDSDSYLSSEDVQIILEILIQREKNSASDAEFNVEKGWTSFKNEYLNLVTEEKSLYYHPKDNSHLQQFMRKAFCKKNIAAVFLCLIMIVSISQTTVAKNLLSSVANWSKETFWFESTISAHKDTPSNGIDINLHDTFNFTNIPTNLLPTWIPENYIKISEDSIETSYLKMYDAVYKDTSNHLFMSITVTYLYKDVSLTYEKDDSNVDLYQKNGIDYYIMGNLNSNTAIWRNGAFECQIDGTLSRKDLKKMIDSIPSSN